MSLSTGDSSVDYKGLAVLIKACNKSKVKNIELGNGTKIAFFDDYTEDCIKSLGPTRTIPEESFQPNMFDNLDNTATHDIIDDEGNASDKSDVIENIENELDIMMINDPSAYEDSILDLIGETTT